MGTHGTPPRGIDATRSPLFEGRFGRMFRNLAPATFGANDQDNRRNLKALGAAMSADIDEPKDGLDAEESGIPALYTYFGQFVDHDITFDPSAPCVNRWIPMGSWISARRALIWIMSTAGVQPTSLTCIRRKAASATAMQ